MSDWEKEFEKYETTPAPIGETYFRMKKNFFRAAWDIQQKKLDEAISVIKFYANEESFARGRYGGVFEAGDEWIQIGQKAREFLDKQGVSE